MQLEGDDLYNLVSVSIQNMFMVYRYGANIFELHLSNSNCKQVHSFIYTYQMCLNARDVSENYAPIIALEYNCNTSKWSQIQIKYIIFFITN